MAQLTESVPGTTTMRVATSSMTASTLLTVLEDVVLAMLDRLG